METAAISNPEMAAVTYPVSRCRRCGPVIEVDQPSFFSCLATPTMAGRSTRS